MNPEDLLRIAQYLASGEVRGRIGRPAQTELRRAVSATYYAMFHALARCCADTLVGATPSGRREQAWTQVYRALDHGYARRQCSNSQVLAGFPEEAQGFADVFADLQRDRQNADYNPEAGFVRDNVQALITKAWRTIEDFEKLDLMDRRAFAVHVTFRTRQS